MVRENPIQVAKMQRKLVTFIALSVYAADSSASEEKVKVSSLVGKLRDASRTYHDRGSNFLLDSVSHFSTKKDLNENEDTEDVIYTKDAHSLDKATEVKLHGLSDTKSPSDDFKKLLNKFFKKQNQSDQNRNLRDVFGTSHNIKMDKPDISSHYYIASQHHDKSWNTLRPSVDQTKGGLRENITVDQETKTNANADAPSFGQETAENSNEYGKFYEGDMIVENNWGRSTVLQAKFWPNGVIPFDFDNNFSNENRKIVLKAINYLNRVTCLHFRKHWFFRDGPRYVKITNSSPGCFATVGKPSKGAGKVNLGPSCMKKEGIIMHELLHSVGLFHEHSRYDRDQYVKIDWENINPSDQHNFLMRNNFQVSNVPYDYYSIMHYSTHAYTKNGLPTLEPKKSVDVRMMGQRDFLTTWDVAKVKNIYCR